MLTATLWIAAGAVLLVAEMKTGEFTLASIALACLAAAVVAGLGGAFVWQASVAAVMALLATAVLAPMMRRHLAPPTTADPIQAMVGLDGEVLEAAGPGVLGKVKVNGVLWQAEADVPVAAGSRVLVMEVLGARLRVMPRDLTDSTPMRSVSASSAAAETQPPKPLQEPDPPLTGP